MSDLQPISRLASRLARLSMQGGIAALIGLSSVPAIAQTAPSVRVSPYPEVSRLRGPERTLSFTVETPVLSAETIGDLQRVQRWSDAAAENVPLVLSAGSQTRVAYERIMTSMFEWAGADALAQVRGEPARGIAARRVLGAVMSYLAAKPIADATQDIRRPAIERWIAAQGDRAVTTFGTGAPNEPLLDYDNNLQASAATLAMASYVITGNTGHRDWAIASTKEVLDEIDAQGFTGEVDNGNPAGAEQRSHDLLNYAVATALMASQNGNPELWTYRGENAGDDPRPALLRAGLLLGMELNDRFVNKRYAERANATQDAYPNPFVIRPGAGRLVAPPGWLTVWMAPFLTQYAPQHSGEEGIARLQTTMDWYRQKRVSQVYLGLPLVGNVAYTGPVAKKAPARFAAK